MTLSVYKPHQTVQEVEDLFDLFMFTCGFSDLLRQPPNDELQSIGLNMKLQFLD